MLVVKLNERQQITFLLVCDVVEVVGLVVDVVEAEKQNGRASFIAYVGTFEETKN